MDMCSMNHHSEIVHDERKCPLCKVLAELDDVAATLKDAKDEIKELKEIIIERDNDLEECALRIAGMEK